LILTLFLFFVQNRFYANWCKQCQKFGEQYKRIAREIGDLEEVTSTSLVEDDEDTSIVRQGDLRMAEIEYGSNPELCKSLGVTKLPAVHIYSSKGKLVDAFRCGPKKLPALLDKLDMYLSMSPAEIDFEADMFEGAILGDSVLNALEEEILAASATASSSSSSEPDVTASVI
jgi:thioredoxin-like negative regulator of GroEL